MTTNTGGTNLKLTHRKFDLPRSSIELSRMPLRMFKFQKNKDGSYSLVNYNGKALTVYKNGSINGVRLEKLNSSKANQKWALIKAPSGGKYSSDSFMLMNSNGQYLEIKNGKASEGAALRTNKKSQKKAQVLRLYPINSSTMSNLILKYDPYRPPVVRSKYDEDGKGYFLIPASSPKKAATPKGNGITSQTWVKLPAKPTSSIIAKRRMQGFQFVKNDTGYSIINMGTGKALGINRTTSKIELVSRSSYNPVWQFFKSNSSSYRSKGYIYFVSPRGGFMRSGSGSTEKARLFKLEPYDPVYDMKRLIGLASIHALDALELDKALDPAAAAGEAVDLESGREEFEMLSLLDGIYSGLMLDASISAANGDPEAQKVLNNILSDVSELRSAIRNRPMIDRTQIAQAANDLELESGLENLESGDLEPELEDLDLEPEFEFDDEDLELDSETGKSELEPETDGLEDQDREPESAPEDLEPDIETDDPEAKPEAKPGSDSSGGCDAGFSILALAGVVVFIKRRARC